MTPRTFFTIVIKIFGIYLLYEALLVIPNGITTIVNYKNIYGDDPSAGALGIIYSLIVLMVYFLILYSCLYKTDWMVDKLALSEHFAEEKFEINIHRSTILRIAVIVIGALIFIDAVPVFCRQVFNFLQERPAGPIGEYYHAGWVIYYFVKIFIGFFLMTSSRLVVNFVERQRKKTPISESVESQNSKA